MWMMERYLSSCGDRVGPVTSCAMELPSTHRSTSTKSCFVLFSRTVKSVKQTILSLLAIFKATQEYQIPVLSVYLSIYLHIIYLHIKIDLNTYHTLIIFSNLRESDVYLLNILLESFESFSSAVSVTSNLLMSAKHTSILPTVPEHDSGYKDIFINNNKL